MKCCVAFLVTCAYLVLTALEVQCKTSIPQMNTFPASKPHSHGPKAVKDSKPTETVQDSKPTKAVKDSKQTRSRIAKPWKRNIICADGVECPSSDTCCRLHSGSYGCCPQPNAVCCKDGTHCCPNGYTCDDGSCTK